ncbi:MAG: alpha-amylase family glycosyl hydrolase, partial [bacterium]|nr:alpha-amylase family glycosyl hydrolase [bacterium]
KWYRNNVRQTNLDSSDSTRPFQASVSNLSSGETWSCSAQSFDCYQYSETAVSGSASVLFSKWLENIRLKTNSSKCTNNEFIWYDRAGDVRDDISLEDTGNYDLTEFHSRFDSQYAYFLFRFREIKDDYRIGLAMVINTNQVTGTDMIGDEMNLTLGSNYNGTFSARLANINLLFHSGRINLPIVEMKKEGDIGWTALTSVDAVYVIHKAAGFSEARIRRDLLNLPAGRTARISLVTYKDYVGLADDVDSSVDFTGNDGLDAAGIGLSGDTNLINYADGPSAWEEELNDDKLDFWFDIPAAVTNSAPPPVHGFTPANNAVISTLKPLLEWSNTMEPDITGYYLELGLTTNMFLYQVNVRTNSFSVPVNLSCGYTNYYWRVYARDRSGSLSASASNMKFRVNISAPSVSVVYDNLNMDNFGSYSGQEDADGNVIFNWPPSLDPAGISNYYICIGTTAGGTEITNDKKLPSNQTLYTARNLARGSFYYAKLKAVNKLSIQGEYSPASDGIYVSRISIDSNTSDWADKSPGNNRTYVTNGTGVWQDALQDARNAYTNLDLEKFKVTFDQYNLYLYFKFNSMKPWPHGEHFIQVGLDNDHYSSTRSFIGRGVSTADLFVSSEASWEYMIKVLSGGSFDTCYACDTSFGNWRAGAYKDNATDRTIECAIPLDKVGGSARFLGQDINLSVAVFRNNSGNVMAVDGDLTPDALDVVATNTGTYATWNAISDQVLDQYLECRINTDGAVDSMNGKSVIFTQPPSYPTVGAGSAGWIQNAVIYFLFVDRFYNGDTSNDVTGSTKRKGGDFQGIMENLDYLRNLNINCIYMAPPMRFGEGGAAGYNTYDWWNVDDHFGSETEFRNLVSGLKTSGIDLIIDWPGTAIGGGPVADNNPNWSKLYTSPWGGWPEWTVGMAEVQQYFSDALTHWASKGVRGFRLDYAKFDGNPVDHGHQYWQYVRQRLKAKFPDRYMYGEIFDSAYKISTYTWSGNELDGCFDFPLEEYGSGGMIKWGLQQSIDSGTFWSEIQSAENTYGNNPIMVSFIDNHDKDRGLKRAGGDSWKMRLALGFSLTWHEPTSLFYGTEMGMDGYRDNNDLDNSPCIEKMWGLNSDVTPWWGGYNYAQHNYVKRLIAGKRSFPALRSGKVGVNVRYASGQWFVYERNYYNDTVLVILNRSSSGASGPFGSGSGDVTSWAGRKWRDWMNSGDTYYTGSDGKFTSGIWVGGNDCRVLVSRQDDSGGFGECSVWGTVNVPSAVVRIKDYAGTVYERVTEADGNGNYSLNSVACKDDGSENRTLEIWAPGYTIQYQNIAVWDTGSHNLNISLSLDNVPPDSPKGVSCRPGDTMMELTWSKNTEDDLGSYTVYRSETQDGEYTKIDEVLDNAYMDNTVRNGTTYYYKVRAKDINGNSSGFSKVVSAAAGPIKVYFRVNMRSSGYNNIQKVLIRGNTEKMNFWGIIGNDPEMEDAGNGWWTISYDFDPRLGIMYKFKVLENGNWHEETGFSGSGSWYGNRYVDFYDQGNGRMDIFNCWNQLGDAAPMAPQNLSASPGNSQVSLSWDRNMETDIRYYALYRRPGAGPFTNIALIESAYNTFMDKKVSNGTTYYYYLNAVDENDQTGGNSRTNSARPQANDVTPPSRPIGVSLYAFSTNQFRISWSANNEPDISGYNLYRSNSGSTWLKINKDVISAVTNPFWIDAVLPAVAYYYAVSALDDSTNRNESTNSSAISGELARVEFKVDMGGIDASGVKIAGTTLPFNWNGLSLSPISDGLWSIPVGVLAHEPVQYRYMFNSGTYERDFSTWHKNREITVDTTNASWIEQFDDWEEQPDVPQNVWAFPMNQKVELHWNKATNSKDLIGYNVYYSTNASAWFENKVNEEVITTDSYTISGLVNDKTYYFIVRSVDGGSIRLESPDSAVVQAVPRKTVPVYFRTMLDEDKNKMKYLVMIR